MIKSPKNQSKNKEIKQLKNKVEELELITNIQSRLMYFPKMENQSVGNGDVQ